LLVFAPLVGRAGHQRRQMVEVLDLARRLRQKLGLVERLLIVVTA